MHDKVQPRQAARLFLMARGRGGINAQEDLEALTTLIEEFAKAGYKEALKDVMLIQQNLEQKVNN